MGVYTFEFTSFLGLAFVTTSRHFMGLTKDNISADLRDLQRNKVVVAEIKADKDFQYYVRSQKRVKNSGSILPPTEFRCDPVHTI